MNSQIQLLQLPELKSITKDFDFIVIDAAVDDAWGTQLLEDTKNVFKIVDPETSKTIEMYEELSNQLLEAGVSRSSKLLVIGGGASSDLGGFVAATILRGISWSVIPTTLLSMIDASIGGKVAINTRFGKNLIGAFHNPETIFLCTSFVETLPNEDLISGYGELIKYAFLSDDIYRSIMSGSSLKEWIQLSVRYKQKIVELDPNENGVRRMLNFGHTFGHAYEKNFDIRHGHAVLLGISTMFKLFFPEGEQKLCDLMNKLSADLKYIETPSFDKDEIWNFVCNDKKIEHENIHLAVPGRNGVTIEIFEMSKLKDIFYSWQK